MMTSASPQKISRSSSNWTNTCESKLSMRMSLNEIERAKRVKASKKRMSMRNEWTSWVMLWVELEIFWGEAEGIISYTTGTTVITARILFIFQFCLAGWRLMYLICIACCVFKSNWVYCDAVHVRCCASWFCIISKFCVSVLMASR